MTMIPVCGKNFSQFKKAITNNGLITDNQDGSFTFSSSDTNSNCYMYWRKPAQFGETITLKVKACALGETTKYAETAPRFAVQWFRNGDYYLASDSFVFDQELKEYTVSLTVNEPVKSGDYIVCSFGHFRSSLISGLFTEAQVLIENSYFPVRREVLGGLLRVHASAAGALPVIEENENLPMISPASIAWKDKYTILITDSLLKATSGTRSSVLFDANICLDEPSTSDFNKYDITIGMLDRSAGTLQIKFTDKATGEFIDWETSTMKVLSFIYNIYTI